MLVLETVTFSSHFSSHFLVISYTEVYLICITCETSNTEYLCSKCGIHQQDQSQQEETPFQTLGEDEHHASGKTPNPNFR